MMLVYIYKFDNDDKTHHQWWHHKHFFDDVLFTGEHIDIIKKVTLLITMVSSLPGKLWFLLFTFTGLDKALNLLYNVGKTWNC